MIPHRMPASPTTPDDRFLVHFDRIVLCRYRSRPDLFNVKEDDMGGEVEANVTYNDAGDARSPYFRVRFGFRELADGRVCVAAFRPDLNSLPEAERSAWAADLIESPAFAPNDPAFTRWSQRYLHGSWASDDGPIRNLERELTLIESMTRFDLGESLFGDVHNPALRYPVAENSEAFTLAQLELFRLVVDGLSLDALKALVVKLNTPLPTLQTGEIRGTMNTLKALLPSTLLATVYEPLRACSKDRNKLHGVPSNPAHSCAAFRDFHAHATAVHLAIRELRRWLETVLKLTAEQCLRRDEVMKWFPRFNGPLRPDFKHGEFEKAVGKTIAKIEAGEIQPGEGCHCREAIIFHFTDGTALAIDVGSNAGNFESEGFDAAKFSSDLIPIWAPNPRA
ncbi:MAG: hypothetical protein KIT24_01625 [Phycisphaeraceae bacterium]|nr:hypothetical protein [Phycisphaeraceae bacterium]